MNGLEKRFRAKHSCPIEIADYDDNAKYLIGWPGYRTSNNKSGLGYMETQAELAHMQGVMIRWLLTGKLITRNPVFLFIMIVWGTLVGILPLIMLLGEVFLSKNVSILFYIFPVLPYMVVGVGVVINAVVSILNPSAQSITG
ncbi:MAG: hypothetical protein IPP66_04135 [Anaerolineales bacterium]|nr:hypothetical protein [Anaerolineales bacterium]